MANLMIAGMVAAVVGRRTSGGVVGDGIGGVGQVLPEPPVHILLHQRVYEKTGESVQGHHGLYQIKALHFDRLQCSLKK